MVQDEAALFAGRGPVHVVANLPYNIGTALLVRWLTGPWPPWWASLTCMFQKEVAQRIVAAPGSDAYGRLAVLAQWRSTPRIAFDVSAQAFTPPPSVTSAVVHLVPTAPLGDVPVAVARTADRGGVRAAAQDAAREPCAACRAGSRRWPLPASTRRGAPRR